MSEIEKEFVFDITMVRAKASLLNLNNRRVSIVDDTIRIIGGSQVLTFNISSFVPKKVKIPEYTGGLAIAALHFDRTKPDNGGIVSLKFVAKPDNHGMLKDFIETYNKLIEANKDVMNKTTKVKNVERDSYDMHYRFQPYSIINKQSCERTERKLVQAELDREQRTGQKSSLLSFTKPSTVQPANYVISENVEELTNPFHEAARRGNMDMLAECLREGVSVNSLDKSGATPLYWAAHEGHVAAVDALLKDSKTAVSGQNKLGDTPLHAAAYKGHAECVRLLLSASANPFVLNQDQKLPINVTKDADVAALLDRSMKEY